MKSGSGVLDVEMYDCGNSVKRWNEKECVAVFCTVVEIPVAWIKGAVLHESAMPLNQ